MIIQAHGLRKRFRVRTRAPGALGALRGLVMPVRRRITAVDDIELAVDRGEKHLTTPVRKLSLGERIRCEIAASLIHDPEILLLDEPTIGLDVVIRQRIRDLIAEVNRERGVTVFLTSHDTGDIEKVCRRAIVINHGRIVWDGAVGELRGSLLATKIMDLKLEAPLVFDQPDVTIRHAGRYTATLEVDTRRTRIEAVVRAILKRNTVLDITISDPPMEEVIAALYARSGAHP